MKDIVIGCDNAAVLLKNCIIKFLESQGIHVENAGCDDPSDPTHYPLIAERVCEKITESNFQTHSGAAALQFTPLKTKPLIHQIHQTR